MRRILILLIGICIAMSAMALTPREAFVKAPREVISAIDSLTRLDMLDYFDSGSTVASRNAFGGDVRVKSLTDESITIATSPSSDVSIIVLPATSDTMLLVVNTLALPAPDCNATVYTSDWKKAAKKAQLPGHNNLSLWIVSSDKPQMDNLENLIPFIPAIYNYNNGILSVTNTLGRLLPADDYKKIKPYIRSSVDYNWTGKKWNRMK